MFEFFDYMLFYILPSKPWPQSLKVSLKVVNACKTSTMDKVTYLNDMDLTNGEEGA